MTGVPAVPGQDIPIEVLHQMKDDILKKDKGITKVVYDISSKPPSTTEWE